MEGMHAALDISVAMDALRAALRDKQRSVQSLRLSAQSMPQQGEVTHLISQTVALRNAASAYGSVSPQRRGDIVQNAHRDLARFDETQQRGGVALEHLSSEMNAMDPILTNLYAHGA